jgi:hypothetical protein
MRVMRWVNILNNYFKLKRICSNESGTFGALVDEYGKLFCMTLEPKEVKLPVGMYLCDLYRSPKRGYDVFKIDIPQEDGRPLEFHIGNTIKDTEGCVLVGGFDPSYLCDGMEGVFNSKMAFDKLMGLGLTGFWLRVVGINE